MRKLASWIRREEVAVVRSFAQDSRDNVPRLSYPESEQRPRWRRWEMRILRGEDKTRRDHVVLGERLLVPSETSRRQTMVHQSHTNSNNSSVQLFRIFSITSQDGPLKLKATTTRNRRGDMQMEKTV